MLKTSWLIFFSLRWLHPTYATWLSGDY